MTRPDSVGGPDGDTDSDADPDMLTHAITQPDPAEGADDDAETGG